MQVGAAVEHVPRCLVLRAEDSRGERVWVKLNGLIGSN